MPICVSNTLTHVYTLSGRRSTSGEAGEDAGGALAHLIQPGMHPQTLGQVVWDYVAFSVLRAGPASTGRLSLCRGTTSVSHSHFFGCHGIPNLSAGTSISSVLKQDKTGTNKHKNSESLLHHPEKIMEKMFLSVPGLYLSFPLRSP